MSADVKRKPRRIAASAKTKRRPGVAPAAMPAAAEPEERPFDEPATPPAKLNVSIEEPVPRDPVAAEEDTCGHPEPERTPASDLH